ncbi:MAG: hypothetical protein ACC652_03330, partial [Acidimicrobiales bacterium]
MFGQLMEAVSRDYVRHIMHVQVRVEPPPEEKQQTPLSYSAPESPSSASLVGASSAATPEQAGQPQ